MKFTYIRQLYRKSRLVESPDNTAYSRYLLISRRVRKEKIMNVKDIVRHWNLDVSTVIEIKSTLWELDKRYILKCVSDQHIILKLNIYVELKALGIPVPEIIQTNDNQVFFRDESNYYFIYRKIEGTHIDAKTFIETPQIATNVGTVIGNLHLAFNDLEHQSSFENANLVDEMNGWIRENITKLPEERYAYKYFDTCVDKLTAIYDTLNRQIIHRDLHLENLLFMDDKVTGYIDFDLTQINVRIFDIAYFLINFMVGKTDDPVYIEKWKEAVAHFLKGYQQVNALSTFELHAIHTMMCCIELLFVAFFHQYDNEDFSRGAEECLVWLVQNEHALAACFEGSVF